MLPNVICLVSMAVYGYIIILTRELAVKYGAITAMVFYQPIMLATMLSIFGTLRVANVPYTLPTRSDYWPFILLGFLYAVGQSLNTTAYALGGKPVAMACLGLTIPLFTSLYLYLFWKDELPNVWQVGGYLVIAGGVLILFKGNLLAQAR